MIHKTGGMDFHSHRGRHGAAILAGLAVLMVFALSGCKKSETAVNTTPASATDTTANNMLEAPTDATSTATPQPASYAGNAPTEGASNLAASKSAASNNGPVRLARFVKVVGDVSWRPDEHASWSQAVQNLPVRQGCQISTGANSRAELQFDDGTRLQLGKGAVVTLNTLYSDADGEYTDLALRDGTLCIWPRNTHSVYQIDTPLCAVNAAGPGRCRVDADNGVQVRQQQGRCTVQGKRGTEPLSTGSYLDLQSDEDPYTVQSMPPHDDFDNWIAEEYAQDTRYESSPTRRYLPRNIALVSEDLDDYGDWRNDRKYGRIWHPHVRRANWRPYHYGDWTWVDPYGWTWVDDEPWGWAPSHYGSWVEVSNEWCWVPGPVHQYWSPAVVNYYETPTAVAWVPLAPAEVRYPPALSIGFSHGDWSLFFSIGGAAVYYPTYGGYYQPRPWTSRYVNNYTVVNNVTTVNNYYNYGGPRWNGNTYVTNTTYVPYNARYAAGASLAPVNAFGGRGGYQALPRDPRTVFTGGRFIGAPTGRFAPVAGPPAVRPTAVAMTPTRTLRTAAPVAPTTLARTVYRAPIAVGTPATVRQAKALAAGRTARVETRFPGGMTGGRTPVMTPRTSQPMGTAFTAGPGARLPGGAISRPTAPALLTPQQRALQARNTLRMGRTPNQPGARPGQPGQPVSPSVATTQRPNTAPTLRPGTVGAVPGKPAGAPPRVAAGNRPGGSFNPRPGPNVPGRPNTSVQQPPTRPTSPNRVTPRPQHTPPVQQHQVPARPSTSPAPGRTPAAPHYQPPAQHPTPPAQQPQRTVRNSRPSAPQHAAPAPRRAPVQQPAPPARNYAPPVRHSQPPAQHAPVVRNYTPPTQHSQPPVRQYQPTVRNSRPSAPRQPQAPAHSYRPQARQSQPPAGRPSAPQQGSGAHGNAPNQGNRSHQDHRDH